MKSFLKYVTATLIARLLDAAQLRKATSLSGIECHTLLAANIYLFGHCDHHYPLIDGHRCNKIVYFKAVYTYRHFRLYENLQYGRSGQGVGLSLLLPPYLPPPAPCLPPPLLEQRVTLVVSVRKAA